jgi:hypothetical protein
MIGGDVVEFRFSVKTTGRQRFIGTRSAVGPQQHRPEALNRSPAALGVRLFVGHRPLGRFRRRLHKIADRGHEFRLPNVATLWGPGEGVWKCM